MKAKVKRIFWILVALILGMTVCIFGVNAYVVAKTKKRITKVEECINDSKSNDAIIVLGAGIRPDGSLTPMLQERLDMGIKLYQQGVADCIIVSGDHGRKHYDEVNAMKDYTIEKGVPSERVFMDHAGFSTYETMYRARDIFEVKTAVVVTQEYHMYRSLYIAEKLGLDVKGVPCDTQKYQGAFYRWAREVLARNKDFVKAIIKPKPTFLGEAIPVTSDGNLTNDK